MGPARLTGLAPPDADGHGTLEVVDDGAAPGAVGDVGVVNGVVAVGAGPAVVVVVDEGVDRTVEVVVVDGRVVVEVVERAEVVEVVVAVGRAAGAVDGLSDNHNAYRATKAALSTTVERRTWTRRGSLTAPGSSWPGRR